MPGDRAESVKRVFISTGEVSGDLQGALLVAALFQEAEARGLKLDITGLGGRAWPRLGHFGGRYQHHRLGGHFRGHTLLPANAANSASG